MLFWKAPPSYWKTLSPREIPTEFSTLLEITTVLLEDQLSFLCSSGEQHFFTGRLYLQGRYQMNFVLSWWVPLSSVVDSVFHKKFLQFFLCYQFLLHQSSHVIFWSPVKLRLYNSKRNCRKRNLVEYCLNELFPNRFEEVQPWLS